MMASCVCLGLLLRAEPRALCVRVENEGGAKKQGKDRPVCLFGRGKGEDEGKNGEDG